MSIEELQRKYGYRPAENSSANNEDTEIAEEVIYK